MHILENFSWQEKIWVFIICFEICPKFKAWVGKAMLVWNKLGQVHLALEKLNVSSKLLCRHVFSCQIRLTENKWLLCHKSDSVQLIYLSVHKVRKLKMSSKHIIYEWTLLQESLQYFYQGRETFSEVGSKECAKRWLSDNCLMRVR